MSEWILRTDRLRLRKLTLDDASFLYTLVNDPAWLRFVGDRGVRTDADARTYIETKYLPPYERHGFGSWCVERDADGERLGICGLIARDALEDVDIGFAFVPAARGAGYALEAARAVLAYGHENVGLRRIVAICTPDNVGSRRVLEGIGMKFDKLFRMPDEQVDLCLYVSERTTTA